MCEAADSVHVIKTLWFWLQPYSTQVVHGRQEGGQVHIAFGKRGSIVNRFFEDSSVRQLDSEWRFTVDPWHGFAAHELTIYENPSYTERAGECRLPGQSPGSENAHPCWQQKVEMVESGGAPVQVVLLLHDAQHRFHLRIVSQSDVDDCLPSSLAADVWRNRVQPGAFLSEDEFLLSPDRADVLGIAQAEEPAQSEPPTETASDLFLEGFRREIVTEATYRNRTLARRAKERDGYICQVCGFDFEATYGDLGHQFAEAHHLFPVAELRRRKAVSLDEVTTVCANCHRMLHRGREMLTVDELRRLLEGSD